MPADPQHKTTPRHLFTEGDCVMSYWWGFSVGIVAGVLMGWGLL